MKGSAHVGGVRGWKARRGACPVCQRDVATGPDYRLSSDPLVGIFRRIKRHHAKGTKSWCRGEGRTIRASETREA